MAAGATYVPITTTTLGSATTSVTFNSIPSTYTDLRVVIQGVQSGGATSMYLRFNGDTGTNYSGTYIYQASGPGSARFTNATVFSIGGLFSEISNSITNIMNYSNTTTYKSGINSWGYTGGQVQYIVNTWRSTSAINSITVFVDTQMATGTTITIYGIAAA